MKLSKVEYKSGGLCSLLKADEAKIALYTDKIKPYISEIKDAPWPRSIRLKMGHRILKSIDYTNRYKAAPTFATGTGVKTTFWAITFSYTIEPILPGLPKVEKIFEGRGKIYLDPDDGQWKLLELYLPYGGERGPGLADFEGPPEAREFIKLLPEEGSSSEPSSKKPPVVDADSDQTTVDEHGDGSEQVTLDGSGSRDSDGNIVSYVWTEDGAQIATGMKPTIDLPIGKHTITLTVTDDDGLTNSDEVIIIVKQRNLQRTSLQLAPLSLETVTKKSRDQ